MSAMRRYPDAHIQRPFRGKVLDPVLNFFLFSDPRGKACQENASPT
jgi:hypothetical protein